MKVGLILVVTIASIIWMARSRYSSKKLPPNARLLCEIWDVVEGSKDLNHQSS